jgi:repressor LexA
MKNDQTRSTSLGEAAWGLRIRELRLAAGLTQDDLAARMETTKATVSKIERSTRPPRYEWVERLAEALGTDAATLLLGDKLQMTAFQPSQIPVIGMIAAGNWREAIHSPESYIPVLDAKPHMFALRVAGDSIDRVAPDGSYVAIDPTNPTLTDGAIYAVQNGEGETTLKRFRRSPDRLEPDSNNPEHKPIQLGGEPITIIGRATQVIQTL